MQFKVITNQYVLPSLNPSQTRFNLDQMDQTTIKRQNQIKNNLNQQSSEYQLADMPTLLEKIEMSKSKNKNGLNLHICCDTRSFSIFGPSVYLYFEFLRKLIILFALLSLLSIIPIAYNASIGSAYSKDAYGITAALAQTTIGSHVSSEALHQSSKVVNVVILTFNMSILLIFWLYWKKITLEQSNRIQKELKLSNYGAVVIEMHEAKFDENELANFLQKFGKVEQIQKVVDIKNVLYYGKKIVKMMNENKIMQYLKKRDESRYEEFKNKINANQHKIKQIKARLVQQLKQIRNSQQVVLRYFVKFDSHQAFRCIMGAFSEYEGFCAKRTPDELLINNKRITVVPQECQPNEIYWQNQSVTWKQSFIPHALMLIFVNLVIIGTLICIGLMLASVRPVYYVPSLASNSYSTSTISMTNQTAIDSWCLGRQPAPENQQQCQSVYELYHAKMVIYIAIAFLLMVCKFIIKHIILFCKPYLRFRDKVEQSKEIIMHLFINYSVVTIIITLSIQTNLFGSAIGNIFISCVQDARMKQNLIDLFQYFDYTSQWYLDYGFQLTLNFFVMTVLPHCLSPFVQACLHKLKVYNASKEKLSILMNKQLEINTFELEDHYASMLCILLAGMIFAGNMPLMIPLVFITLIAKYYTTKYLFLHLNQPPPMTDRTLANKIPPIFLFIITAYLINSIWAYGVQSVFSPQSNLFEDRGITADSNAHNPFQALLVFLKRLVGTWQPFMVYIIGIIAIIIRKLLLSVFLSYTQERSSIEKRSAASENGENIIRSRTSNIQGEPSQARVSYMQQINNQYGQVLNYINSINY